MCHVRYKSKTILVAVWTDVDTILSTSQLTLDMSKAKAGDTNYLQ